MLTHNFLTIDEETFIHNTSGSLYWIPQGRFGIWLLNFALSSSLDPHIILDEDIILFF